MPRLYGTCGLSALIGWSVLVPLAVFAACSALDMLRLRLVEPAFLRLLDGRGEALAKAAASRLAAWCWREG